MKLRFPKRITRKQLLFSLLIYIFIVFGAVKLSFVQLYITGADYPVVKVLIRNLLFISIVYSFPVLFRRKWVIVTFWMVEVLFLAGVIGYFIYSGQILQISQIILSFNEWTSAASSSLIILKRPVFYVIFLDIPILILLIHFYRDTRESIYPILLFNSVVLLIPFAFFLFRSEFGNRREVSNYGAEYLTLKHGMLATQLILMNTNSEEAVESIVYGEALVLPDEGMNRNLLIIQAESLNSDVIGFEFEGFEISPYLNRLSREAVYYPYLIAQHKAGNSSDAEFSVLNSAEAFGSFPASRIRDYDYPNSLPHLLADYDSVSFHGNNDTNFDRNITHRNMGFSDMVGMDRMGYPQQGWGISDEDFFTFVLSRIPEAKEPFLYYLITMSTHGPFTNVLNYHQVSKLDGVAENNERNYLLSINYLDGVLESFITSFLEIAPDTVIMIYGDHTVDPGGSVYKAESRFRLDGSTIETVPLFILTPDGTRYRDDSSVASFLDLSATLALLSGRGGALKTLGQPLPPFEIAFNTPLIHNGISYNREELRHEFDGD